MRTASDTEARAHAFAGGVIAFLYVLTAAALQIAVTLHAFGNEIRIVASDFLVGPLLAALILLHWRVLRAASTWRISGIWFWLTTMTTVIVFGVVNGYMNTGGFIAWAVVNKGAGWFVLLAYFALGAGLGLASTELRRAFLRTLFAIGWLVALGAILAHVYLRLRYPILDSGGGFDRVSDFIADPETGYGLELLWRQYFRLSGAFANPNAYGLLLAAVLLLQLALGRGLADIGPRLHAAGLSLLLLALYFSESLSAWIGFATGAVALASVGIIRWRVLSLVAAIATLAAVYVHAQEAVFERQFAGALHDLPPEMEAFAVPDPVSLPYGQSLNHHFGLARDALAQWTASPIWGVGIGHFLWAQQASGTPVPQAIHPSLLWLLAETGIVGVLVFIAFYVTCAKALYRAARGGECAARAAAVFAVLMMAGAASVGMEVTYQRHLWLFLGFGLIAVTQGARQPVENCRLKMRYKKATKSRKGTNPFTGEPATFKAKPATLQPRFTAGKALKDEARKYFKKKMK